MKVKKYEIKEIGYNLYLCFGDIEDFACFYEMMSGDKLGKKNMMRQAGISVAVGGDIFCMVHRDAAKDFDYVDVMIHEVAHALAELFTTIGERIEFKSEFWANYVSYYIREGINFLEDIGATKKLKNNNNFKE